MKKNWKKATKLITNIIDLDFTTEEFKVLYFRRWGIEVKYSQLKSRYELENFSGVNPIAIMQDFYATIYLSNLMTMAKTEANANAESIKNSLKYEYFNSKDDPNTDRVFL